MPSKVKAIINVDDPHKAVGLMGHPYRAAIVAYLERRDTASPRDVARHLDVKLENLAYHFKVLRDAGAIELVKVEQSGATIKRLYRLVGKPRISPRAWASLPQFFREVITGNNLQQLWRETTAAAATGAMNKPTSVVGRFGVRSDARAFDEIHDVIERAVREIKAIEERAVARIDAHETMEQPATFVAMLFETPDPAVVMTLNEQPQERQRRRSARDRA